MDGQVFSWGENSANKLGLNSNDTKICLPKLICNLNGITSVKCGFQFIENLRIKDLTPIDWIKCIERFYVFDDSLGVNMLFVTKDDRVYGLGANHKGSLGLGHNRWVSEPQEIIHLRHKNIINFINGYNFFVCISSDNCVYSCGYNIYGQLGQGFKNSIFNRPMIIKINAKNDLVIDVSCGSYHTLVVTENNNEVYGWGSNSYGQIGSRDITCDTITTPEKIHFSGNYSIKSVHCFDCSSFALTMDGQVFSWGSNSANILGLNSNDTKICLPQLICNLNEFIENLRIKDLTPIDWIKCIERFYVFDDSLGVNMLFVTKDDRVYGLGANHKGSLGLGHNRWVSEPQEIIHLRHKNIINFINGNNFFVCISSDNYVYSCGYNICGQLGQGFKNSLYNKPMIIQINAKNDLVSDVSCGSYHTLVVTKNNNEVYGWGNNTFGQIGSRHNNYDIIRPEKIKFSDNYCIKSVHCFDNSSFALTMDGQVFSWGQNRNNQLGHYCNKFRIIKPTLICNLSAITSIQSGTGITYFFTNYRKEIYFCGKYYNENNEIDIQKTPKLSKLFNQYIEIQSIILLMIILDVMMN
ncbi:E3 ubiquitin-protein ligase HERC2-like [Oppia nitens]|uniref:E3 ubiquitin-protein ligase HERC2-like n=1 Tax=Oppia nitens TaxID=1686743 RepID=UPI0023DBEF54|nr:E3 ubiquitin-protein ligase HERC2-like [Oppia nitens]